MRCTLKNGKGFREPTERDGAYHLKCGLLLLFSVDERLELGNLANGKEISDVPFYRKKRSTSGDSRQFPNKFSGKLLFHLTFNRNFRIFWLNGKRPRVLLCVRPYRLGHEKSQLLIV